MALADLVPLVVVWTAAIIMITVPLVLLPWVLDRRGVLPYNSVRSRILAWSGFAAVVTSLAIVAGGLGWDLWGWLAFVALIAFATAWDVRDMKVRRIPKGRHPDG